MYSYTGDGEKSVPEPIFQRRLGANIPRYLTIFRCINPVEVAGISLLPEIRLNYVQIKRKAEFFS